MFSGNKIKRRDYEIITTMIHNDSSVLDLGCGDGSLLLYLKKMRNVTGYGVDKDHRNVLASLTNGINVLQSDLEQGLAGFGDSTFDYVILSLTLQAVHETETIINEMLRVGKQVIVTFPNFGLWRHRLQIFLGRTPISKELPHEWYDTPNVHVLTINDFEKYCSNHGLHVRDRIVISDDGRMVTTLPNLLGAVAIYRFNKGQAS
ncbi:MAG: methionine biosynthesis protein MetW [Burkholderiales bacterium]|nr:methionine biosynthesis protein MetW [Burkholderiales bacterium]OUT78010.1 MAG: methionine biosynthesis protein MetW [Betaproteobacteria bacterium TMED22]|tara:strand:- start:602 stop:1213 length:612 start_codon:yes stop_codon:yes gene_type:complete